VYLGKVKAENLAFVGVAVYTHLHCPIFVPNFIISGEVVTSNNTYQVIHAWYVEDMLQVQIVTCEDTK
jgi:hypothetical protein